MMTTESKNRYRKDKLPIFSYSEERRRNIGKARLKQLDAETLKQLQEYWEKRYVPEKWILTTLNLSKRVYSRYLTEHCKHEQIKFLPQNLSPDVYQMIISRSKEQVPYKTIAEDLDLECRQVRKIICKLAPYYDIVPVSKPRYVPDKYHRVKLANLLSDYNHANPKKREQNPNWKGGKTKLVESIRKHDKYKAWRLDIFERDKFTCILCQNTKDIQADHIKPFSVILLENGICSLENAIECKELWNRDNGRTLCKTCHHKQPTHGTGALKWKNI
jgi:5-methylcytosine-specific restriction endonuclease McrA